MRFGRLDEGIRLTYSDELPDLTTLDEHPPSRAIGVVGGTYSGCGLLLNVDLQITVHLAGDVTGDDLFNSADLLSVFQAGQYEDDLIENSTWYTGDWDGDGEFTSSDLVVGFVTGEYQRMATVAVPEPAGWTLLLLAGLTALGACHRDRYPDILRK